MRQYQKYLWSPDMEATYLSRSISKMLEAEEPVGDPFGGAAYGCKEFSLRKAIGIGAAVVAIVATAGAAAPLLAGSLTVASVSAGLVVVGSALTIASVATGNEKLGKIGGTLALVGGIGLAANAALGASSATQSNGFASTLDDAATAAKPAAQELSTAGQIAPTPGADLGVPPPGVDTAGLVGADVADDALAVTSSGGAGEPVTAEMLGVSQSKISNSGLDSLGNTSRTVAFPDGQISLGGNGAPNGVGALNQGYAVGTNVVTPDGLGGISNTTYQAGLGKPPGLIDQAIAAFSDPGKALSNAGSGAMSFAKENPLLAYGIGNTAVSAIGGAVEARATEKAAAKARQQELDDRQFYNDSINGYQLNYDYSNVQSPYGNQPVSPGVFQSPPQMVYDPASQQYVPVQRQQPQQPRQGLIANNMQRMA